MNLDKVTLSAPAQTKWSTNLLKFLIPVVLLYIGTISGVISQPNHIFGFKDFIPTQIALGGIILYVLNGIQDYLRKMGV